MYPKTHFVALGIAALLLPRALPAVELPVRLFEIPVDEQAPFTIGFREYHPILPREDAKFDVGHLVNLSTRARIAPGGEAMIGGFVIERQHRTVLIRGVGPALAAMGVSDALENPHLVVHRSGNRF